MKNRSAARTSRHQPPNLSTILATFAEARALFECAAAACGQDAGPELTVLRIGLQTFQRGYTALDRADVQLSAARGGK